MTDDSKKIRYMAFDPGKRNGIAAYNSEGDLLFINTVRIERLIDALKKAKEMFHPVGCGMFIIERYLIYPQKAKDHIYSDVVAVQAIGRIEGFAETHGIKVAKQNASIKATGFKYLGIPEPPRSDPTMDAMVAHAHGTYWLVENGILDKRKLLRK